MVVEPIPSQGQTVLENWPAQPLLHYPGSGFKDLSQEEGILLSAFNPSASVFTHFLFIPEKTDCPVTSCGLKSLIF